MSSACLTTCIYDRPGDRYTAEVLPITAPLFGAYCERWGLDYRPWHATLEDTHEFRGFIPTVGTEIVYASIPHRRSLLNRYDVVVYVDLDAVVLDGNRPIHEEVSDEKPIGMVPTMTGALQVLWSNTKSKEFLDYVWDMRHAYKRKQWAEEGIMKEMLGWDPEYEHGEPSQFLGETEWTPYLQLLDHAMKHPLDPNHQDDGWWAVNAGGIWPFERRLGYIKDYAAESNLGRNHSIRNA